MERLHQGEQDPKGWGAKGHPEWGPFKLGHTQPEFSNSGLLSVLAEAYAGAKKTRGLAAADLANKGTRDFVSGVERTIVHYGKSTGLFAEKMIERGPTYLSAAVLYENLVISQIENAQGRWGNLRVYYPETTLWSDHPVALLQGEWVSDAQKAAARSFIAFLKSRPIQERALAYGFRSADPSVPIRTADDQNPYARLEPYGVKVEVPPVATPPDGPVIRNMLTMWSRVVGSK